jgi:ABC-type dipeptide/oligopeptide/nickel transport system permease subunit
MALAVKTLFGDRMSKPLFWFKFCLVQAVGLFAADYGYFHSNHLRFVFGMILLLPGILLAIGMFAAFGLLKSTSIVLLAPGMILAIGINAATWFGIWYGLESRQKEIRRRQRTD